MNCFRFLVALWFIILGIVSFGQGQEKYTVSGYITDATSGEELIGATVAVEELSGTGAATNIYGFYSITLPTGQYTFRYTYLGYKTKQLQFNLNQDLKQNIALNSAEVQLEEVIISADKPNGNVESIRMSKEVLKIEAIKSMPALFGEVDVFKSLQLLPGIISAGEGTSGLFVRGGSADQNLILLDESTVYNASHFMGFFSVFNPDAIKNVTIYKGGIPAKYGGRISSIVDIQMKEGNNKRFAMSGGIGTISSRLTLEGPIVKDKASYMISGRRTYADLFLKLSPDENINSNTLYFYDLNAKANYKFNNKNRLYISGYFGRDVFKFDDTFGLNWGNATATLRWNHLFSEQLFLNTTLLFSNYDYGFDIDDGVTSFKWDSRLQEYQAKLDFSYYLNPANTISFGTNTSLHYFSPAHITSGDNSIFTPFSLDNKYAFEHAFYIGNDHKINDRLSLRYGLRYSLFYNIGPGRKFRYAQGVPKTDETIIDTVQYAKLDAIKFYHGLEPRASIRYMLNEKSSVKASYNRMRQYLQIASNSTAGLPIDRWIPADSYIKPLIGDQIALGYFRNFSNNRFETSVEVYYKWMDNLIDFKPHAEILLNNNLETEVFEGRGWAYGAEFYIKKNTGKTKGWLSYTLSNTKRKINGINGGKAYNARYDRTHDISLVISHQLNPRLTLAANWVYATGAAVSFPEGHYTVDGQTIPYYDDQKRNANRMPNYHRLDLSATLEGKNKKNRRWQGSWTFSIYNVYARKNAFSISFREVINGNPDYEQEEDGPEMSSEPSAVKMYLFSIIPSITYNFKF